MVRRLRAAAETAEARGAIVVSRQIADGISELAERAAPVRRMPAPPLARGKVLGLTRERVRQIEQNALRKIAARTDHGGYLHE